MTLWFAPRALWRVAVAVVAVAVVAGCAAESAGHAASPALPIGKVKRQQAFDLAPDLAQRAAHVEAELRATPPAQRAVRRRLAETLWEVAIVEADRIATARIRRELASRRAVAQEREAAALRELSRLRMELSALEQGAQRVADMQAAYAPYSQCAARHPRPARCPELSPAAEEILLEQAQLWLQVARLLGADSAVTARLMRDLGALRMRSARVGSFTQLETALRAAESELGRARTKVQAAPELRLSSARQAAECRGLSAVVIDHALLVTWSARPRSVPAAMYALGALGRLFPEAKSELVLSFGAEEPSGAQARGWRSARSTQRELMRFGVRSALVEPPAGETSPGLRLRLTFPEDFPKEGTTGARG